MASWAGMRATATPSQVDAVARAVRSTPIIDHHAHPLLKPDAQSRRPLLAITTEAVGNAVHSAAKSLPHLRAVRQLASVLGCAFTWESVVASIEQKRLDCPDDWTAECLAAVETILVDDGLDGEDGEDETFQQPYAWHDDYTRSRCKRIVRVEQVAADSIRRLSFERYASAQTGEVPDSVFDEWLGEFDTLIVTAIDDPDVVAFKSVICYRTGLHIAGEVDEPGARAAFKEIISNVASLSSEKLWDKKSLNDLVVHRTATMIRDNPYKQKKPMQFHTGLGDHDLTLPKASPSHLQDFIRAYPALPIVLLHAGYPFTREAGYLASVHENVYADIGEVFPCVSQDGQERILREMLEICPWSKILWSTDGHWFPETYLLAVMQMRDVFETVLCDYVRKGQIGWIAAVDLVRDVLFKNSNRLYHLNLEFSELEEEAGVPQGRYLSDADILRAFLKNQPTPDFVRICWTDFTPCQRVRLIPFRKFASLLDAGGPTDIGISKAVFGRIQNDRLVPNVAATGEYRLHPDFSSLRKGPIDGHITMRGEFREQSGARVPFCPRTVLQRAVEFGAENGLAFLLGFEVEFLLAERAEPRPGADDQPWSVRRCSSADPRVSALLRDMVAALEDAGVYVEQVHAERAAAGRFALSLPPGPPVEAVDALLHARDIITTALAASAAGAGAGFKLALHPKPFPAAAARMHLSISSPGGHRPEVYQPFYAGVLRHLRAVVAFACANPASYDRNYGGGGGGGSSGGWRWVAWGTQNREAALRKVEGSHWEVRCVDVLASPYLAAAAVLFAGVRGAADREPLAWGDCEVDPARLTANDRRELGVRETLPASAEEALAALREDDVLVGLMGAELVERYVAVKEFELAFLGQMGEDERRRSLMEQY